MRTPLHITVAPRSHAITSPWLFALYAIAHLACFATAACSKPPAPPSVPIPEAVPTPLTGPSWRPGYERPRVVDAHAHVLPTAATRAATIMQDNGLARMVNLSGGVLGRSAHASVEVQRSQPEIVHFMNVDWRQLDRPDFGARMASALETAVKRDGFRGLKISKALGLYIKRADGARVPVDWPGLDPLWAKAGELDVPVAIHTGDPKAFWDPVTPENERYDELRLHPNWSFHGPRWPPRETLLAERDRVIARHPDTTFICVHVGNNPEDLDAVDAMLDRHPNALIDTAARLGELGRHPPERVRAFFDKHKDRVIFGTDLGLGATGIMLGSVGEDEPTMADVAPFYEAHWRYFEGRERGIPHPTPIQGDWTIDAVGLGEDVLRRLYRDNAARLLKLDLD